MNGQAHPLFGGPLGDAGRSGAGVGLAPLSEGFTAFVPNPGAASMPGMTGVQQTAFPPGVMNPAAMNPMVPATPHRPMQFNPPMNFAAAPGPHPMHFNPKAMQAAQPPRPMQFNPGAWPGMQATQQTAFPPRVAANPGSHAQWMHRSYGGNKVRYQTPQGASGYVEPHRVYITPSGALTSNPYVINAQTKYLRKWLPAAWGPRRPGDARGPWVQLSAGNVNVGLLHAPGMPTRPVTVLQVENTMYGGAKALVRHRKGTPGIARAANPSHVRTVSTRRRRRPRQAYRITAGELEGGVGCKLFPGMPKCQPKVICPPGYEKVYTPKQGTHCLPSGSSPGRAALANPRQEWDGREDRSRRRMAARGLAARNPPPRNNLERLTKFLGDLGTGRKRLVLDRKGITVQDRAA